MTLTLLTDPELEFVERVELALKSPPGVVILDGRNEGVVPTSRTFVYAYRENPDSFVYREATHVKVL